MTLDKDNSRADGGAGGTLPGAESDRSVGAVSQGSPIEFRLDPGSGVPTYLQLVHHVEHALRLGYLEQIHLSAL